MRSFLLTLALTLLPLTAQAIEAPPAQTHIDANKVLRGNFVEDHQTNASQAPLHTSGHFVVAPAHGLIWGIEKPFPTATIITPNGAAQDLGGLAVKLPAKNLHHLYDMVGGALEGNWTELEEDFSITRNGDAHHWQMLLTPHTDEKPKLPYTAITVSGSRFVENIVMAKADGSSDAFSFTDAVLSPATLTAKESTLFSEVPQ